MSYTDIQLKGDTERRGFFASGEEDRAARLGPNRTRRKEVRLRGWLIQERCKGEPAVAACDLMNEPRNNDGFESEPNYKSPRDAAWRRINDTYRETIDAVRAVDPDHAISLEGIWRVENLPCPEDGGWTNMLYRGHDAATPVGGLSNMDGLQKRPPRPLFRFLS